jgi:hypothetical protein
MKLNKSSKPTMHDKQWQREIEKKVKVEKIILDNPEGKDRFEKVIKKGFKKIRNQ